MTIWASVETLAVEQLLAKAGNPLDEFTDEELDALIDWLEAYRNDAAAGARGIRLAHTPYSSAAESSADGRGQQYWR